MEDTEREMSESERAYHRKLFRTVEVAQASWQAWIAHLNEFYALTPRDAITAEGFERGPAPPPDDAPDATRDAPAE